MHEPRWSFDAARAAGARIPLGTGISRTVAGMAVVVLALASVVVGLSPGQAAPLRATEPVSAFLAPRCEGSTTVDPSDPTAHPGLDDLLSVSGPRLVDYNAGAVVPLYDAAGRTEDAPLCGTRQVVGPDGALTAESQWMFCTAYVDDLCGDVDESGQGTDSTGVAVGRMDTFPAHPTLSADAQRLIGYLIENGHSYVGTGADYSFGGTARADAGTSTDTRRALQVLVWCISDPDSIPSKDFRSTCRANLPAEEQVRLLALIPTEPVVELDFDTSGQTVDVGQTARVALTTNLFAQPITVTATPANAVVVCSGDATITSTGTVLTVAPPTDGSTAAVRIELCATPTAPGPMKVDVSAPQASLRQVSWNRSASVAPARICQVFAAFVDVPREPKTSAATFVAVATPKPTPTPDPDPDPTDDPTPTPTDDPTPTPTDDPTPTLILDPPPIPPADPPATLVSAVVLPHTPTLGRVGSTTARPVVSAHGTVSQAGLAHTGADARSLILLAGAAGLTGVALVAASRLRLRRRD